MILGLPQREEACLAGDRESASDVRALQLLILGAFQGYLTIFTINNVVRELIGS